MTGATWGKVQTGANYAAAGSLVAATVAGLAGYHRLAIGGLVLTVMSVAVSMLALRKASMPVVAGTTDPAGQEAGYGGQGGAADIEGYGTEGEKSLGYREGPLG